MKKDQNLNQVPSDYVVGGENRSNVDDFTQKVNPKQEEPMSSEEVRRLQVAIDTDRRILNRGNTKGTLNIGIDNNPQ